MCKIKNKRLVCFFYNRRMNMDDSKGIGSLQELEEVLATPPEKLVKNDEAP